MVRMITIPLFVLFLFLTYFFFEVPILKLMAWSTGDGLINSWVIYRLDENNQMDEIQALTTADHAKTRLFALRTSHQKSLEKGLEALPAHVEDESWEVRMQALRIAKVRRYTAAGNAVVRRLASQDPMGESRQRWNYERQALMSAMEPVASAENAESLARMALSTEHRDLAYSARSALWPLGPLPQAEQLYSEILRDPKNQRPTREDHTNAMRNAAILGLPDTLKHLLEAARNGRSNEQLEAIKGLGDLGGEGAVAYLKSIENAPGWQLDTDLGKQRQKLAIRALERIRRRKAGEEDIPATPKEEPKKEDPKDPNQPTVEDLLASYGSGGPSAQTTSP